MNAVRLKITIMICLLFIIAGKSVEAGSNGFECDFGYWAGQTAARYWEWDETYYSTGQQIPPGTYKFKRTLNNTLIDSLIVRANGFYDYSGWVSFSYGLEYALISIDLSTKTEYWQSDSDLIVLEDSESAIFSLISLFVGFDCYFMNLESKNWSPYLGLDYTLGMYLTDFEDNYWSKVTAIKDPNPTDYWLPECGIRFLLSEKTSVNVALQYRYTSADYRIQGVSLDAGLIWKY